MDSLEGVEGERGRDSVCVCVIFWWGGGGVGGSV